jgi:hypothetical protein
MRARWMSRVTLPVVLIAAAVAWPTGASASGGVVPSAPSGDVVYQHPAEDRDVQAANVQPPASDGFEWADVGIGAAIAVGLLGMAGGMLLFSTRARRRTA